MAKCDNDRIDRRGASEWLVSNRKQAIWGIGDKRSAEPGLSPSGQVLLRQASVDKKRKSNAIPTQLIVIMLATVGSLHPFSGDGRAKPSGYICLAGFLYIGNAKLRLSRRRWVLSTHTLTVCYELAADFAELYRAYGAARMDGGKRKSK